MIIKPGPMQRDVDWLNAGWAWLAANEGDPQFAQMEDAWLDRLHRYEMVYALVFLRGESPCS